VRLLLILLPKQSLK